jgi:hypothetical protein
MPAIFRWVAAFVLPVALLTASCGETNGSITVPGSSQSTGVIASGVVMAEPPVIAPQFLTDPFCGAAPPFLAVVGVTVSPATDLFLQQVRFDLVDRFGGRAVPTVSPIPMGGVTTPFPTSTPIPMPTSPPIPTPGQVSFGGLQIASGQSRTDSFSLRFDCGVIAAGVLSVIVESTTRLGIADVSRTSVRVGA